MTNKFEFTGNVFISCCEQDKRNGFDFVSICSVTKNKIHPNKKFVFLKATAYGFEEVKLINAQGKYIVFTKDNATFFVEYNSTLDISGLNKRLKENYFIFKDWIQ